MHSAKDPRKHAGGGGSMMLSRGRGSRRPHKVTSSLGVHTSRETPSWAVDQKRRRIIFGETPSRENTVDSI